MDAWLSPFGGVQFEVVRSVRFVVGFVILAVSLNLCFRFFWYFLSVAQSFPLLVAGSFTRATPWCPKHLQLLSWTAFLWFLLLFCRPFSGEQEEVFLYGEEISVDATEKEEEVCTCPFSISLTHLLSWFFNVKHHLSREVYKDKPGPAI